MKKILKMLFKAIMRKYSDIKSIETLEDLCKAVWNASDIACIFAAMNDDQDGFSTEKILKIADEAYQEVLDNE